MKKIVNVVLLLLMSMQFAYATDGNGASGIKFQDLSYKEAIAKAKKENKLIFIDVYTTWCGPCKLLKKNTFPDKALGDYFNKNFISITADAEQGEWIAFSEQSKVQGYPTLMVLDKNGKEVGRTMGYMPAVQLLQFGKDVKAKHK